jgi:DnaK suppressor protein
MTVKLPKDYRPSPSEPFMNAKQREYFRRKLIAWREELLEDYEETREQLGQAGGQTADYVDLASNEADRALELRTRDRERKLIAKIDEALERLRDGTYGICADTGKPIGLARLEARPTASLSIEAQEAHEKRERMNFSTEDIG